MRYCTVQSRLDEVALAAGRKVEVVGGELGGLCRTVCSPACDRLLLELSQAQVFGNEITQSRSTERQTETVIRRSRGM